ncbi:MAG: cupin domain-containing protein [Pseudonocardiales bacterium]|nr:cupin domain-containing protein [Pseudonocardiales bacterium]
MLPPDGGRVISGGAVHARLLVAHDHRAYASTFEMRVAPGFDVGAHVHRDGEEMFFVLAGEIDILCLEPLDRTIGDWHRWQDRSGRVFLRGGPGAFMYVPPGSPHAFANPTGEPARMFFQSSVQGGHENYFAQLGQLLHDSHGKPGPSAVRDLEARYGTEQITAMRTE